MTQRIIRVPETPAYAVSVSVTHAILYKYFIANINCSLVLSIKIILRKIVKNARKTSDLFRNTSHPEPDLFFFFFVHITQYTDISYKQD